MPGMRILTASEPAVFDKPPLFDHGAQKSFFDPPKDLMDTAAGLRTNASRIGFLLLCGYFKATKQFYPPQDFYKRDIEAVAQLLGLQGSDFSSDLYAKQTRTRHQQIVLDCYGFMAFGAEAVSALAPEIATMARMHLKPRLMFDRCVDFLMQRRVQVPRAGTLLERIRTGLHARKAERVAMMEAHLTDETRDLLDDLFNAPDDQNRYRLTLLKKRSQSTKPTRIKECIADFKTPIGFYSPLECIISVLDLGVAGIRYYAGSVLKSEVFQIQQREVNDRHIHVAAFVAHQFYRMQDHLVDLWLNVMACFQATALREYKERLLENRQAQQEQFQSIVKELDASVSGLIRDIRRLTDDNRSSDAQKVAAIRAVLDCGETGALKRIKADLETARQARNWYDLLEAHSLRVQNRLNPILRVLNFQSKGRAARLITAINHFQAGQGAITEQAPVDFLNTDERAALAREDGTFRPSLYKVFLFQQVTEAIKSGDLNLTRSYKYHPMDS